MAGVTRKQLKAILKECIEELIDEGSFNAVIQESVARYSLLESKKIEKYNVPNETRSNPQAPSVDKRQLVQSVMGMAAPNSSMFSNDILRSIFEDTAANLEPTDENGMPVSFSQPTAQDIEQIKLLESISGEGRWAELAFGSKKNS